MIEDYKVTLDFGPLMKVWEEGMKQLADFLTAFAPIGNMLADQQRYRDDVLHWEETRFLRLCDWFSERGHGERVAKLRAWLHRAAGDRTIVAEYIDQEAPEAYSGYIRLPVLGVLGFRDRYGDMEYEF